MSFNIVHNKIFFSAAAVGLLLFGFGAGWFMRGDDPRSFSVRETSSNYKYIAPLLFVKTPEEDAFPEYRPLKDAMSDLADRLKREGKVQDISFYFRNLNTSQWVGVNTEQRFSPASMLKVITLMGVLREAQFKPSLLSATIQLPQASELPPLEQDIYAPENPIMPGRIYTVSELIEHMIVDSDNIASYALHSMIGDEKMYEIYDDLELARPGEEEGYTVQEYSRLFRTLYNGTYLSRSLSEQVLDALTKTNFTKGILQGVPQDTIVSHKFGIRTLLDKKGVTHRELHDCGIVYYPDYPYFLCVMTRGTDFSALEGVLKDASALVWQEVSALH